MIRIYHRQITQSALENFFTPDILEQIIIANLNQDKLNYQVGHPHFHFDDSAFTAATQYLENLRKTILNGLRSSANGLAAWQAFGRLTHAAQDFYAHSNYVSLWLQEQPSPSVLPAAIPPLDAKIINSGKLRSGHIYHLHETFGLFPLIGRWVKYTIPIDSHTWMNLDTPERSPLFEFAYSAAMKRTIHEYKLIVQQIGQEISPNAISIFRGVNSEFKEV